MDKVIEIAHTGVTKVPVSEIVDALLERFGVKPSGYVATSGTPRIGQPWPGQGGVYAGMMKGVNGVADYPLILATEPTAYFKDVIWGPRVDVPGATCEYDGWKNTQALLAAEGAYPAAGKCSEVVIEGHKDFYLPSRRELALLYANVGDLVETGDWYWSSTQFSSSGAWMQRFGDGYQTTCSKGSTYRVRAIRRVL